MEPRTGTQPGALGVRQWVEADPGFLAAKNDKVSLEAIDDKRRQERQDRAING